MHPPGQHSTEEVAQFAQELGLVDVFPSLHAATVQKMLQDPSVDAAEVLQWIQQNVAHEAYQDGLFARQVFIDVLKCGAPGDMPSDGLAQLLAYAAQQSYDAQHVALFGVQEYCHAHDKCATSE